jgi:hypothetical protein
MTEHVSYTHARWLKMKDLGLNSDKMGEIGACAVKKQAIFELVTC